MLENVQEFAEWGPLNPDGRPCKARAGQTFRQWTGQLERLGYRVEFWNLRACDYGAPTIRKRLVLVARCDGLPITLPRATHGEGKLLYRTAASCIDWSIPCPSIFDRKKPLAPNTLNRIAKGVQRYVLETAEPFIVPVEHGRHVADSLNEPTRTIVASRTGSTLALVSPYVSSYYGPKSGNESRAHGMEEPLRTQTTENRHALVAAFLAKHYGGVVGHEVTKPTGTITSIDHHAVVAAHLLSQHGSDQRQAELTSPAPTICAGGNHAALVAALLAPYYGSGSGTTGRDVRDPTPTVTTNDRLQLVTVNIDGETYVLSDIGMRMLQPRELFRAQGFPDSYIIDHGIDEQGNEMRLTKKAQVRMCGNSVCPPLAAAIVRANFTHEIEYAEAAA